jgi:uncharacterized RDD family membrane protein YckC
MRLGTPTMVAGSLIIALAVLRLPVQFRNFGLGCVGLRYEALREAGVLHETALAMAFRRFLVGGILGIDGAYLPVVSLALIAVGLISRSASRRWKQGLLGAYVATLAAGVFVGTFFMLYAQGGEPRDRLPEACGLYVALGVIVFWAAVGLGVLVRPKPGDSDQTVDPLYAGFWKRLAAGLLDYSIVYIGVFCVSLLYAYFRTQTGVTPAGFQNPMLRPIECHTLGFVGWWLYAAEMERSTWQATPGKMALGIQVTDVQGNRVSFRRATGRHFAKIVSLLPAFAGFTMVGVTRRKQGLHDLMAGCIVLNRASGHRLHGAADAAEGADGLRGEAGVIAQEPTPEGRRTRAKVWMLFGLAEVGFVLAVAYIGYAWVRTPMSVSGRSQTNGDVAFLDMALDRTGRVTGRVRNQSTRPVTWVRVDVSIRNWRGKRLDSCSVTGACHVPAGEVGSLSLGGDHGPGSMRFPRGRWTWRYRAFFHQELDAKPDKPLTRATPRPSQDGE